MMRSAVLAVGFLVYASQLSDATTASGLGEALKVATQRAVQSTSKPGGFLDNSRIRIALPGKMEAMASGLRAVGMGAQVDELEVAMNHAAERAAGEATPVFVDAIQGMSFQDAAGILKGGDTAATDYFKKKTTAPLTTKFRPIVDDAMQHVGVTKLYESLVGQYTSTPFVQVRRSNVSSSVGV